MARPQGPVLAHRYHPAHRHQRHPRARYGPGQNHSDRASSKAPAEHLRPPPVWTQTIHHLAIHHTGGTQPSGISWASAIQIAAALAAIGGAATALYRLGQVILRRTVLSHRHLAACLNQLACGVTTQYIDQIFGPPAFRRAIDNNQHAESYWFGNPGFYQVYVLAYNDAGCGAYWPPPSGPHGTGWSSGRLDTAPPTTPSWQPIPDWLTEPRQHITINTLLVSQSGPDQPIALTQGWLGVDAGHVRTLRTPQQRRRTRRNMRKIRKTLQPAPSAAPTLPTPQPTSGDPQPN